MHLDKKNQLWKKFFYKAKASILEEYFIYLKLFILNKNVTGKNKMLSAVTTYPDQGCYVNKYLAHYNLFRITR